MSLLRLIIFHCYLMDLPGGRDIARQEKKHMKESLITHGLTDQACNIWHNQLK